MRRAKLGVWGVLALALWLGPALAGAADEPPTYPELADGERLIRAHDWSAAEDWFYRFVKKNPDHAEALRKLGLVELRRPGGDIVRAKQYLERANRIEPEDAVGRVLLAKVHEILGEPAKQAKLLDGLLAEGPVRGDPIKASAQHLCRFIRGVLHERQGEFEAAEALFQEVLKREPAHAYASYELGLMALERGDGDAAIEHLSKAVEDLNRWAPIEAWLYPAGRYGYVRENAAFALGRALLAAGRAEEAAERLRPLYEQIELRDKARRRPSSKPKAPVEGEADVSFENAPFYYGEALAAAGRTKDAVKVLKNFSRMRLGDPSLRQKARSRAKELR